MEMQSEIKDEIKTNPRKCVTDIDTSKTQISCNDMIQTDCKAISLKSQELAMKGNDINETPTAPGNHLIDIDNSIQLSLAGITEAESGSYSTDIEPELQEIARGLEIKAETQPAPEKFETDNSTTLKDDSNVDRGDSKSAIEDCVARLKAQMTSSSPIEETCSDESPCLDSNMPSMEIKAVDDASHTELEQGTSIIAFLETGDIEAIDSERNGDKIAISNRRNPKSVAQKEKKLKVFQCALCEKKFKKSHHLVRHQGIHTQNKQLTCDICEKSFKRKLSLQKHSTIHSQGKCFECENCLEKFSLAKELKKHKNSHICEQPFNCQICGKTFKSFYYLKDHISTHSGKKPFQCSSCDKGFNRPSHLKQHQHIHTGEKLFQCTNCDKTFTRSSSLLRHQQVHSGEKPHQCGTCGKSFSRAHHLREHERLHTGERPFSCSVCEKSFNHSGNLIKHQRVHTKEKPFKCTVCDKCFNQSSSLTAHQRIHARKT